MSKPSRHLLRGAALEAARALVRLDPLGVCTCGHQGQLHYPPHLLCMTRPAGHPCRCRGFQPSSEPDHCGFCPACAAGDHAACAAAGQICACACAKP